MNAELNPSMLDQEGLAFLDQGIQEQFGSLLELCVQYAGKPVSKNDNLMQKAVDTHMSGMRGFIKLLDDKTNTPENIDSVLTYIKGMEVMRVDFLNLLSGEDGPTYITANDDLDGMRDDLFADEDEIPEEPVAGIFYHVYEYSFNRDIAQFRSASESKYEERPGAAGRKLLRKLGSHTLDVAKISVGVVAGIAAAKKLRLR